MPIFRVYFHTTAETYVDVEVPDADEYDAFDIGEIAYDKFDPPDLCASCSGWNSPGIYVGDAWEISDDNKGVPYMDMQ